MKIILPFLLLLSVCFPGCAIDGSRLVVQSGHSEPVTALAVTSDGESLVSISKDGTLRVWDTTTNELIYRVQISALPLVALAVHPNQPRAAVIESDGISTYRLSVWDWSENRRIFSRNLEALPLYLSFSPAGSFLAYSVADWQSMTILDSNTGSRPQYLEDGFGIVSAFRISVSERRILVYLPSGSVQYRDLRSGTLVQEYKTLSDVDQISFVSNNRYMIGVWGNTLVAVDLLSGSDVASVRMPNLESYTVDENTGAILCVVGPDSDKGTETVTALTFTGSNFRSRFGRYVLPPGLSSNYVESDRVLYTGTQSGAIYYQSDLSNTPRVFSSNRLMPVTDFDATESLIVAAPQTIMTFYADFLFESGKPQSDEVLTYVQKNPLQAPVSIHPVGRGTYVLHALDSPTGRYQLFSPISGAIEPARDLYKDPLVSFDTRDGEILTVDTTGKIQLYELGSNSFVFEKQILGVETAVFTDGDSIVAAGRRSQTLRTSKLLIDTYTGETVPFIDASLETFLLDYDPVTSTLFTLSLEGTSANMKTILNGYTGAIFDQEETLYSVPGRVTNASMSVKKGTLFLTTGGVNRALYTGTDRFMPVESNNNIPVKVEVIDNWMIGLNRDHSLSVWERATGKLMLNFYLFENESWAAVTSSGATITSTGRLNQYLKIIN